MLKRPSTAPVIALLVLISILFLIFKKGASDWVDIGKGGPEKWQDYPYRLIDLTGGEDLPSTHPDLTVTNHLPGDNFSAWKGSLLYDEKP